MERRYETAQQAPGKAETDRESRRLTTYLFQLGISWSTVTWAVRGAQEWTGVDLDWDCTSKDAQAGINVNGRYVRTFIM